MTVMDFPTSPTNGQTTTDGRYYFDSSVGSSGAWRSTPLPVGGLPAGSIMQWSSATIPNNWLLCDGSAVSRSVYSSLFAIVGTTYGVGDGATTFNLPDIPSGDAAGVVNVVKSSSQILVTTTRADLSGMTATVTLRAGRTYRFSFTDANVNNPVSSRVNLRFLVNGTVVDQTYTAFSGGIGGISLNSQTYFTPSSTSTSTVKLDAALDGGSGTTTLYADANSFMSFVIEDMGLAASTMRPRNIIKASAGWTAGDSELATRVGALETADATTNRSGLVPVTPTSVSVGAGTASVATGGKVSFSSTSNGNTISLNGCFTSAYTNYKIVMTVSSGQANGAIYLQLTQAGTPSTTGYLYAVSNAGVTANNASVEITYFNNLGTGATEISVFQPADPYHTSVSYDFFYDDGGTVIYRRHGAKHRNAASFDGFRIYGPTSATGTIQVYGIR